MSDEDFLDALDCMLDNQDNTNIYTNTDIIVNNDDVDNDDDNDDYMVIDSDNDSTISSLSSNSWNDGTTCEDSEYYETRNKRRNSSESISIAESHYNNNRTSVQRQNKRAFMPLYSQKYGLSLDGPSRFANRLTHAFNFNDTDLFIEHFDPLLSPIASISRRLYDMSDSAKGFGSCKSWEYDKASLFYDFSRQMFAKFPDAVFTVLDSQAVQLSKGFVINLMFVRKGTVVESTVTPSITNNTSSSSNQFIAKKPAHYNDDNKTNNIPRVESDYDAEATALLAELGEDRITEDNEQDDKSILEAQDTVEQFDYAPLVTIDPIDDDYSEILEPSIAVAIKPFHIAGMVSMYLDDCGQVQHMDLNIYSYSS